ncbi:hypothetical protein XENTR_v10003980 [Xenopus tropicalis]|nr:hypothetical protein XENTR_v10003980 [Xenopus tropicalis]
MNVSALINNLHEWFNYCLSLLILVTVTHHRPLRDRWHLWGINPEGAIIQELRQGAQKTKSIHISMTSGAISNRLLCCQRDPQTDWHRGSPALTPLCAAPYTTFIKEGE